MRRNAGSEPADDAITPRAAPLKRRGSRSYGVIGRLAPGVSPQQAQAELETVVSGMRTRFKDNYPQTDSFGATLYPLKEQVIGGMKPLLLILLGAVALVLPIACANLATMMLARATARERETAIRVAVGASRFRLLRQSLTEGVVLSILGAAAGMLLAFWAVDLVKSIGTQPLTETGAVHVDLSVLLVTLGRSRLARVWLLASRQVWRVRNSISPSH